MKIHDRNVFLRFLLSFPILVLSIVGGANIFADSNLGYTRELQVLATYNTKSSEAGSVFPGTTVSGPAIDVRINFSTIGMLFFRDSPFMFGDHIGFGIGAGYFSKTNSGSNVMMPVNFEGGLKAAYKINDDFEVGIKWIYLGANQYMDYKNDFYIGQKNAFAPTARYKDIMATIGFGTAMIADNPKLAKSDAATGTYLMAEGRYFFGDKYILVRFEKFNGTFDLAGGGTRTDSATQFTAGFGMM
ncbi:MAG: hypothetical protein KF713_00330 [Turneriella sp.]|nr:hypothetical protein [Turneriella sp.]